jgi:hypothetical protein
MKEAGGHRPPAPLRFSAHPATASAFDGSFSAESRATSLGLPREGRG